MKFEVFRNRSKEWRWRLRAANGEIIATSGKETYRRKIDCMYAVRLVQGSGSAKVVEL